MLLLDKLLWTIGAAITPVSDMALPIYHRGPSVDMDGKSKDKDCLSDDFTVLSSA